MLYTCCSGIHYRHALIAYTCLHGVCVCVCVYRSVLVTEKCPTPSPWWGARRYVTLRNEMITYLPIAMPHVHVGIYRRMSS